MLGEFRGGSGMLAGSKEYASPPGDLGFVKFVGPLQKSRQAYDAPESFHFDAVIMEGISEIALQRPGERLCDPVVCLL